MKYCRAILVSFAVFFFLLLPQILFGIIENNRFQLCGQGEKIAVVYLLALILTLTPYGKFKVCFILLFSVCNLIQFCYAKYFGSWLTPYAINFIFLEFGDVALEARHIWTGYIKTSVFVILPFILLLQFCRATRKSDYTCKHYLLLYLIFFGYFFYLASTPEGTFQMLFKNTCVAPYNTINSFTAFFGNILPQNILSSEEQEFTPYEVKQTDKDIQNRNIILVVGESTNAANMSLFNPYLTTTPKLTKRAESDKNFTTKTAWAAAVNTLISLPMMYNLQVHPKDWRKLVIKESNLLRLAKNNGYKVIYAELQNASVFRKTGIDAYDNLYIYDQEKDKDYKNEEEYLDVLLPKISLTGKNFIIIHQRNIHSPYEENFTGAEGKYILSDQNNNDPKITNYNRAMLMEDSILDKIISWAEKSPVETYFYYISDHGEALGQNGLWGHGHLDEADLRVPFLFTMFNSTDTAYQQKITKLSNPCSYQIMLLITEKLGYDIKIPEAEENVCLINGRDSMGRAGYLKIQNFPDSSFISEKKF